MTSEHLEIPFRTFLPYAAKCRDRMISEDGRFVHYTSAESALKIIQTKRIWMRNTTCMSDYREVQHGFDALNRYFSNQAKQQAFIAALNECSAGAAEEGAALFGQWLQNIRLQTYIASISEHDHSEDLHGRLSMWRGFGGGATARVALVVKVPMRIQSNPALPLTLSPVGYFTDEQLAQELDLVTQNVRQNCQILRGFDRNLIVAGVFNMLVVHTVCLKHEGFREEKEWRIIYSPQRSPSPHIECLTEIVGGVPQMVYKIPLENKPAVGISGLDVADLLERVIIGPSQFPWVMFEAFVAALDLAGVKDAASRVCSSLIPIRT
jgi:hypothetical protein